MNLSLLIRDLFRLVVCLPFAVHFCPMATAQTVVDASLFQKPERTPYVLDSGDTLGVFVEGVTGEVNSMPPIHDPPAGSDLPPAMGYPTLILHDGTIRLPLVEPISVRGLSVPQVETLLQKTYVSGKDPIINERSRVIVSLMRKRTVSVMVVRGDQSQAMIDSRFRGGANSRPISNRSDRSGRIYNLQLPAGENDLLNAMIQTGGLPGVNAKDELIVFRHLTESSHVTQGFPRSANNQQDAANSQSFPLRSNSVSPSLFPRTQNELRAGDIVSIAAKPTAVFYTGGLLGGGEYLIPRDRPLSVIDAISLVGGIPASRGNGAIPLEQPRLLTLIRRAGNTQFQCRFDLRNGYSQQASETIVQSGDYLILDYSPSQRVQNIGIGVFNIWGVRELFRD